MLREFCGDLNQVYRASNLKVPGNIDGWRVIFFKPFQQGIVKLLNLIGCTIQLTIIAKKCISRDNLRLNSCCNVALLKKCNR